MDAEKDATGRQKIVIMRLCMAQHVEEHLEDRPMSKGEAGKLIREMSRAIKRPIVQGGKR